ncbi:capsule assembly Wzi family protein [Arundinibacter roseus]|uniref:Capsule assembly Wzi family protein n=1 Tax=Arundinibacter roseus TaxID=2070510 RepID=A0A4R4JVA0_9BACT|nr:capsule assembly Wzi family protein [Arundinibacter roseus]TDB58654.1 hypothetical protein EZE20_22795 [Arundinibacter roseus]
MIRHRCTLLVLIFLLPFSGIAQVDSTAVDFIPNYVEVGGLLTNGSRTPFWQQSNRFGTIPRDGNALMIRGGMQHTWALGKSDSIKEWRRVMRPTYFAKEWRFQVGVEGVANVGKTTDFLLPQAYGAVQFGNWELMVGRRKQWIGIADSTLSSGSYAWSGNALPLPKIQFGLSRYTAVPYTKNWVQIIGFYSDGWFEKNRPVTSELKFHQKQLYGRIGKPDGTFKLLGGINHQVQWGGKSPYETINGQMPKGFENYIRMALGQPSAGKLDTATFFDNSNRVGNHLGTLDAGFEITGRKIRWLLYRQNIYEDGSLFRLTNIKDGLNGISLTRLTESDADFQIHKGVFEVLYTKNQGGSQFIFNQAIFGKDNYFNHAQVRDGWGYFDRGIGTPFIPPTSETVWRYPNYGDSFTSNNRVWVFHTGLQGSLLQKIEWSTRLSFSSNAGVYDLPFLPTAYQFSGVLNLRARTSWLGENTFVQGSLAADIGDLYPKSYGLMLSIRKEGLF